MHGPVAIERVLFGGRDMGQDRGWDRQRVVCVLECRLSMVSGRLALESCQHGGMAFWHADDPMTVPAAVLTQTPAPGPDPLI